MGKEIRVTEPALPELSRLQPYLEAIWQDRWLTNNGPLHQELERQLADYLNVEHISLVSNATLGLILALKVQGVAGEVITTPFSFVATGHSLLWNNLTPVFVDVNPKTLNLDPEKIREAITPRTQAILPVHCFGNPCDTAAIQEIADAHNLKVIYDAAHAFGVELVDHNILDQGDMSVLSFHATKTFNTFEGGAVISKTSELKKKIDDAKNFGISSETTVDAVGINAKLNEFSAAMGLLQLEDFHENTKRRKKADEYYRQHLEVPGISFFNYVAQVEKPNFGYFPIFVEETFPVLRDELYIELRNNNILARRYFYPLISDFEMYRSNETLTSLPNAVEVTNQVLCLPIYPDITESDLNRVISVVTETAKGS